MMRAASAGPMPGNASRSASEAVLTFTPRARIAAGSGCGALETAPEVVGVCAFMLKPQPVEAEAVEPEEAVLEGNFVVALGPDGFGLGLLETIAGGGGFGNANSNLPPEAGLLGIALASFSVGLPEGLLAGFPEPLTPVFV